MANPELGGVNRTIEDGNAVVNSGSGVNKQDPDPTSDTEQYGGVDMSSQKAGSKKKACFQITSVSKRNAAEHDQDGNMDDPDSNDELDESRADEFSSSELVDSFNVSKNSIPDLDPSVDNGSNTINSSVSAVHVSGTAEEQTNSNNIPSNANQANGNGPHRFKVVKVATEPIRKGRWTCRDFPSETAKSQTTPESLRNQDSSKEMLVHSGNSSAASSVHYIHGQDNSDINPLSQVDESGKPVELGRKISTTSLKETRNHSDAGQEDDEKDDRLDLDQLKDGLLEHTSESTEGDDGTSPAGGAIDNKIEQAMDLVKSHLLFAVREEVEVLKEQIKILVEKNDKLQEENTTLKQRLQASGAPAPGNPNPGLAMAAAAPHQGMPIQPPSQEQPQYPNMPNQMGQNLGQNPMGQALSDHAAYPQHPRPTQQTHSTPNPGGLADANPQYTPQTNVESQGQYHSAHSQLQHLQSGQAQQQQPPQPQQQHLAQGMQDMSQYSQVAATAPQQQTPSQATPQQTQAQYHTSMAPGAAGNRPNTTH